jgi:hypothetical protein
VIDRDWELDMAHMAWATNRVQIACCAASYGVRVDSIDNIGGVQVISPGAERRVIQSSRNWVKKSVKCGGVLYSFYRESFDLCGTKKAKIDAANGRWNGLRNIHLEEDQA